MFVAEKMAKVTFLLLQKNADAVLDEIVKTGVMQPARIEEMEVWAAGLPPGESGRAAADYLSMQQRITHLLGDRLAECRGQSPAGMVSVRSETIGEIEGALAEMEAELLPLVVAYESAESRLAEVRAARTKHASLIGSGIPLSRLGKSTFLTFAAGVIEEGRLGELKGALRRVPAVVVPYERKKNDLHILCVVLRKDSEILENSLREVSFREQASPDELLKVSEVIEAGVNISSLEEDLNALTVKVLETRKKFMPDLAVLLEKTEAALVLSRVRAMCRNTGQSCLLAGWVPARRSGDLISAVKRSAGNSAVVEVVAAEDMDKRGGGKVVVPVLFDHAGFLKPFEWIVDTYGIPSYRMIDPTLLSFIAFLIMFGIMFGDIGHGAVLVLAGVALGAKIPAWRTPAKALVYCGISACVFGLLFGSVFGIETLVPALWVHPVEGINTVFAAAILFGMAMLTCGIALNTINAFRTHTMGTRFFESAGPLGGIIYWLGILVVAKFLASSMDAAALGVELTLFMAFLALFFFREPARRLLQRERPLFPGGVTTCVIEGAVEVMELLMGYLANTLSFIRVAAFGLAHAGLLVAVFGISDLASQWPAGTLFSALILVLGNAIVIVFEGAVVTIQILRLQYYEFFSKFFNEFGVKYSPVHYAGVCTECR